jgi:hypothetical protein
MPVVGCFAGPIGPQKAFGSPTMCRGVRALDYIRENFCMGLPEANTILKLLLAASVEKVPMFQYLRWRWELWRLELLFSSHPIWYTRLVYGLIYAEFH